MTATPTTPTRLEEPRALPLPLLAVVPILTAVLLSQHPDEPRDVRLMADDATTWIWLHLALLLAVPLLGMLVWHLLRGLGTRAARVSRMLLAPAVALYAAFDALVGIGTGVLLRGVAALPEAQQEAGWALVQYWWDVPGPIVVVGVLGPLTWAVAVTAAAIAHLRVKSPWSVVLGLVVTASLFAWGHPGATGVVAMTGLLVALLVHARAVRSAP